MNSARPTSLTRGWMLLRVCLLLLPAAALIGPDVAAAKKPPPLCQPMVPCADSRGCPDMVIDRGVLADLLVHSIEFRTFASDDCVVLEGMVAPGTRKLLQFSTMTVNLGAGDLVLGNPEDHPDWFDLVTCHGHPHLKDYAAFRLWKPMGYARWQALRAATPGVCADEIFAAHPDLLTQLVSGTKHAFCVEDENPMKKTTSLMCPSHGNQSPLFDCGFQGISVCWADVYFPG